MAVSIPVAVSASFRARRSWGSRRRRRRRRGTGAGRRRRRRRRRLTFPHCCRRAGFFQFLPSPLTTCDSFHTSLLEQFLRHGVHHFHTTWVENSYFYVYHYGFFTILFPNENGTVQNHGK